MTFGVPSGRTEGVNIPDKGSASPEYALTDFYWIVYKFSTFLSKFVPVFNLN